MKRHDTGERRSSLTKCVSDVHKNPLTQAEEQGIISR